MRDRRNQFHALDLRRSQQQFDLFVEWRMMEASASVFGPSASVRPSVSIANMGLLRGFITQRPLHKERTTRLIKVTPTRLIR